MVIQRLSTVTLLLLYILCAPRTFASHDEEVNKKIISYLEFGFRKNGEVSVAVRVQTSLAQATAAREANTTDTILRDSEYYLHGLYAAAAKDIEHGVPVAGAPVYDAIKWAAFQLKSSGYDWLEKWLRTDPDKPISEPGGWRWAYKGLQAGAKLDGEKLVGPSEPPVSP